MEETTLDAALARSTDMGGFHCYFQPYEEVDVHRVKRVLDVLPSGRHVLKTVHVSRATPGPGAYNVHAQASKPRMTTFTKSQSFGSRRPQNVEAPGHNCDHCYQYLNKHSAAFIYRPQTELSERAKVAHDARHVPPTLYSPYANTEKEIGSAKNVRKAPVLNPYQRPCNKLIYDDREYGLEPRERKFEDYVGAFTEAFRDGADEQTDWTWAEKMRFFELSD